MAGSDFTEVQHKCFILRTTLAMFTEGAEYHAAICVTSMALLYIIVAHTIVSSSRAYPIAFSMTCPLATKISFSVLP